jgi:DNA-directed RNA polymerase specialized sigma24 family protein
MPINDNSHLVQELRDSSADALGRLCKRYFQSSRRWLRRQGVKDSDTPGLFADIVLDLTRFIQEKKVTGPIDFEHLLRESTMDRLKRYKDLRRSASSNHPEDETVEAAVRCFSALDESHQRLLEAHYVEGANFEEVARRFGFGNASIAEFEIDRAMNLLEGLVKVSIGN